MAVPDRPGPRPPLTVPGGPDQPVALGPGVKVLVNGAAGGVGHLAVQLAKWKGAHVTAVASGTHESFLRDIGADEFIDYTTTDAEKVARDFDLVLDTLGGPNSSRSRNAPRRSPAIRSKSSRAYMPNVMA